MRLPFVSRFAYDEMKAELTVRALKAEADREKMLNKILRLSVGSDGELEPVVPEELERNVSASAAEPQELTVVQQAIRMAGGSKRPSILRRMVERINADKRMPQPSRLAAVNDMSKAFDEGAAS